MFTKKMVATTLFLVGLSLTASAQRGEKRSGYRAPYSEGETEVISGNFAVVNGKSVIKAGGETYALKGRYAQKALYLFKEGDAIEVEGVVRKDIDSNVIDGTLLITNWEDDKIVSAGYDKDCGDTSYRYKQKKGSGKSMHRGGSGSMYRGGYDDNW